MNLENLRYLVERYGQNFPMINDQEHDEIFKWAAVRQFQRVWFDPKK